MLIVFAHPDGMLPNAWYRAYKRARRSMRQASYDARVDLLPINSLPRMTDVLVVPPELTAEVERVGAGDTIVAPANSVQAELDRCVRRLVAEGRLTHAPDQGRAVAVHIGFLPLHERARVAD